MSAERGSVLGVAWVTEDAREAGFHFVVGQELLRLCSAAVLAASGIVIEEIAGSLDQDLRLWLSGVQR